MPSKIQYIEMGNGCENCPGLCTDKNEDILTYLAKRNILYS